MIATILELSDGRGVRLSLKLEGCNPFGSIKDRPAHAIIERLVAEERLVSGRRIIESSSGNLAVALAGQCRARGFGFVAVVDPNVTPENLARLEELGADIVMVRERDPTGGFLLTRLAEVERRCELDDQLVWTDQYHNPANPAAHYHGTAPEVHEQMGDATAVFVAVSTGGTFAGMSAYFADHAPEIRVIAVDVEGSVALGHSAPRPRHLSGVGAGQRSHFAPEVERTATEMVSEARAVATCCWLAEVADLPVGASSGAAIAGALQVFEREPELEHVVCVCPDFGSRYASTVYDEGWRAERGFDETVPPTLRFVERPPLPRSLA